MTVGSTRVHPALAAAERMGLAVEAAARVEVIDETGKSAAYRVRLAEPRGRSLVVKRCADGLGEVERMLYERVLPVLSVSRPQCCGSHEDADGVVWLALEDAGDDEPSLRTPASRAALTEWAATLHREGARLAGTGLPDRGPAHFRRRLDEARARLVSRLDAGGDDADDRDVLHRAVERCDRLVSVWPRIESICERFPRTLVHGDLVEENLRVTTRNGSRRLVALDWEKAGWGVPAVDLVRVDADLYRELTQQWLACSREGLEQLVFVGRLFRVLVHRWTAKSIGKTERADVRLGRLLAEARWEAGA